jgi:hypothetical protein
MRRLIYAITLWLVLFFGCSDDNPTNNNNNNPPSNIIYSRYGLVDSLYNTNGNIHLNYNILDTIQFSNYNHIRIKVKLNGSGAFNNMSLFTQPCDTCVNENFFGRHVDTLMNVDTTVQSPNDGMFGVMSLSTQINNWISIRDLVLEKQD